MSIEFWGGEERELSRDWGYCNAGRRPSLRGLDLCDFDPAVPPIPTTAQPSTFGTGISPSAVGGSELSVLKNLYAPRIYSHRTLVIPGIWDRKGSSCLDSLHFRFVVFFFKEPQRWDKLIC